MVYLLLLCIIGVSENCKSQLEQYPGSISAGFLSEQYYYLIPILFATAVGGSCVGRKIVTKIDQDKFKKMVLIGIILVSIKFIIDSITEFL